MANKTEAMSLNLSQNIDLEILQHNINFLQKEFTSKNKMVRSLLEVQSALIESIIKSALNKSSIPKPTTEPVRIQPMPTLNLQT